jgi:hypothetical protein
VSAAPGEIVFGLYSLLNAFKISEIEGDIAWSCYSPEPYEEKLRGKKLEIIMLSFPSDSQSWHYFKLRMLLAPKHFLCTLDMKKVRIGVKPTAWECTGITVSAQGSFRWDPEALNNR